MGIRFTVKGLVYKQLEPFARALGCKMILIDRETYQNSLRLDSKMKVLGISPDERSRINSAIDTAGAICILRSQRYKSYNEIAQAFKSLGLRAEDVNYLDSVNVSKYELWGDLDASIPQRKRKFFCWFPVEVLDSSDDYVLEENQRHQRII